MKNDPEFNIRFVKVVEKYPQLYNYTLESYSNKQDVDRAWKEIATTLNETVVNVVAKWTTLRNNFNRSLRESAKFVGADAENRKCYYLAQYMQFLLPFFKSRNNERRERKLGKLDHQETESSQDKHSASVKSEEEQSVHESGDDTLLEEVGNYASTSDSKDDFRMKRKLMSYTEGSKKQRTESKRNPDIAFFQSLLPLVENLSDSEKIRFRISCMQSLQQIVDKVDYDLTNHRVNSDTLRHAQLECSDGVLHPPGMNLKFECNTLQQ